MITTLGPPGPPGPPGSGYDAASLAAIMAHSQISSQKGPDPLDDQPTARLFGKDLTEEETKELITKAYEQLKSSFEKYRKRNGEKGYPGKTCKDILINYPESKSGQYWVDPNEDDPIDAILVHCDMDTKATCIMPTPSKTKNISYKKKEQEVWLSDIDDSLKVK